MAFHVYVFLPEVFLLLSLSLLWCLCWLHHQPSHSRGGAIRSTTQRLFKPRTPLDCPACCNPQESSRQDCGVKSSIEHRFTVSPETGVPGTWLSR